VIYENGSLKRILVDGGYIEGGAYYFYLTDHLGNNRVVANASGGIVQTNHFYPFGMSFAEGVTSSGQPYKYNGKELDMERGLNLYDYSARLMDPALGRFATVDPKAEKYYSISPYTYCINNPMKFVDPNGKEIQNPPGKGYWNWSRKKQIRVAKHASATNAAANNAFKGSGVSVSGSVWSIGGGGGVGSVKGKIKVALGHVSVNGNGDQVSTKLSIGETSAELSVSSASLKTGVSLAEGKATIDKNANASADFESISADAKVQVGDNPKVEMNSDTKVGISAKVSIAEVDLSIDFKAVGQWFVGALNTITEILTPEIEMNTIKR
jgi:RHS repeat-associated protein